MLTSFDSCCSAVDPVWSSYVFDSLVVGPRLSLFGSQQIGHIFVPAYGSILTRSNPTLGLNLETSFFFRKTGKRAPPLT